MNQAGLWIRRLPIALFAIFGGTALILCNPGYYWDDWVWIFQPPAETIRIGRELGIWWGGYATNLINSLPEPALSMRAVSLVAWVASAIAAGYVLHVRRHLLRQETFLFFLIYCTTHVSLVRFLTSVAFYNLYIAAFWIGCALYVGIQGKLRALLWSVPFFFFSFYLNSLLLMYTLLFAVLASDYLRLHVDTYPAPDWRGLAHSPCRIWPVARGFVVHYLPRVRMFAFENIVLIALPFVFLISKRLTTIKSPLYGTYNDIDQRQVLSTIGDSFALIVPVIRDFFSYGVRHTPSPLVIGGVVISLVLLLLLPRSTEKPSPKHVLMQAIAGVVLFVVAVYPYLVVGKVPDLTSFYESRHIMPAMVGPDLIILAMIGAFDLVLFRFWLWRMLGRTLLIAYVLGSSIACAFNSGTELWRDWFRQTAIMDFVRSHPEELKDVRTFVIDDRSNGTRIGERMVWNYEYTGELITVFGTRDRFGISIPEYTQWGPRVPLLTNPYLRPRYNIANYDFSKPHAILTITNGPVARKTPQLLTTVVRYLKGDQGWHDDANSYTSIELAYERIVAEQRVHEMYDIAKQLAQYRLEHGSYPTVLPPSSNGAPMHQLQGERAVPPDVRGDIPGLFSEANPTPESMQPYIPGQPNFLYLSDGNDYKLVYDNPPDMAYAKQAHPALIDPVRTAYGVWTLGARSW
ncbi:hypothetical protein BUMB_03723c [Candidatus Paraburkholderia calva]|nr:hypothetical protein BUMB_03723c [Candidatus Paraburkholderia calva]